MGVLGEPVGLVLGTDAAFALEFWVYTNPDRYLQLDDVVTVHLRLPDGHEVQIHGVVDQVRSRFEGARFDSDAALVNQDILTADVANAAHVTVTRVEPEIFVAPYPGQPVYKTEGELREQALSFDKMIKDLTAFPAGLARDGKETVYGNLEFLDGTRGAHMNISGISGVATKTSYALFLLYSLFHSDALGKHRANTKAVIFNVKGEDLLFLDKPNSRLEDDERAKYGTLQLPVGPFRDVGIWAPVRKGVDALLPSANTRADAQAYAWSLAQFCRERMLSFLFAEGDDETSRLAATIRLVERWLELNATGPDPRGFMTIGDDTVRSFSDLVDVIEKNIDVTAQSESPGTRQAFLRRLFDAAGTAGHLVRPIPQEKEADHRVRIIDGEHQVTVIDINELHDRAKRFVVGTVISELMKQKEGRSRPLVFLVLDELNKYAPREGNSPIKNVILDIAERGRSLGVVLIGAQQTASEIERRVTANASFRVAGRLDAAEATRAEYGFLAEAKARASILKPGTMFLHQPEIPVPLLVQFPFPAWATRRDEVDETAAPPPELRGGLMR